MRKTVRELEMTDEDVDEEYSALNFVGSIDHEEIRVMVDRFLNYLRIVAEELQIATDLLTAQEDARRAAQEKAQPDRH